MNWRIKPNPFQTINLPILSLHNVRQVCQGLLSIAGLSRTAMTAELAGALPSLPASENVHELQNQKMT
jgi:hypothetical protein